MQKQPLLEEIKVWLFICADSSNVSLVEAYIQRYRPSTKPTSAVTDENKAKPKWENRPWDQWKVKFQLKKLYVLYVGDDSGDAPGDVPDADEEF